MEFKVHKLQTEADLISIAQNALRQIEEKDYVAQPISNGILPDKIFKYGIAFKVKEVWIEYLVENNFIILPDSSIYIFPPISNSFK